MDDLLLALFFSFLLFFRANKVYIVLGALVLMVVGAGILIKSRRDRQRESGPPMEANNPWDRMPLVEGRGFDPDNPYGLSTHYAVVIFARKGVVDTVLLQPTISLDAARTMAAIRIGTVILKETRPGSGSPLKHVPIWGWEETY